ncbi:hypothetical protein B0H15DRAFT_884280 [Mycena belliarum]|uniref:Protein kinase domain-containing protein n=1 Tax=Mycena belliarum TaxID=1033014 RepID=A0AAD6XVM5_9AGAR|nr:hypothetical protein B0H15DRAFT_884280 [Mycena belliae]
MTTLTINCTLNCDRLMKREPGALALKRVFDFEPQVREEEWTVNDVEAIQEGTRFWVFRAQIIRPAGVALDAILKIDPTGECEAACKNELKVYQTKGKVLQGTALPKFYGCFQVRIGAAMVTCLAMEYCGEPLKKNFDELDADLTGKLLIAVVALHGWGLTHGDLYPRNVRVADNTVVLIDFESSESHTCGRRMKIAPGATMPTPEEFGCAELHRLAFRMGMWKSNYLAFNSVCFNKDSIRSVEDLKCLIWEENQPEWEKDNLEQEAEFLFEELCEERMLTWGTTEVSDDRIRRDIYKPAAPSA